MLKKPLYVVYNQCSNWGSGVECGCKKTKLLYCIKKKKFVSPTTIFKGTWGVLIIEIIVDHRRKNNGLLPV